MKKIYSLLIFSSLFAQTNIFANSLYFNAFTDIQKAKRLLTNNPQKANSLFIEARGYLKQIIKNSINQNKPSSQSMYLLGELYLNGWGGEKNPQKATLLLCSANSLGNMKAQKLIKTKNLSCPTQINIKELAK